MENEFIMHHETGTFSYKKTDVGLFIQIGNQIKVLEFFGEKIIRVNVHLGKSFWTHPSPVIVNKPEAPVFDIQETSETIILKSPEIIVRVAKNNGALSFFRSDESLILAEKASDPVQVREVNIVSSSNNHGEERKQFAAPSYEVKQSFVLQDDEAVYGLGQCSHSSLDLRNREILIVQTNIPAFVPVFVSSNSYGILWEAYSQTRFSDSREEGLSLWSESAPGGSDYYLMTGDDLDEVIAGYRHLSGAAPMFHKQAFGLMMSKERYRTQQQLIDVVNNFRNVRFPIDYIVQDWQYWKAEPGMWNSAGWDPERFPDPEGLCDTLHNELHVKLMVSIWPSVGDDCALAAELDAKKLRFEPLHWITKKARVYDAYSQEARDIYFKHMKKGLLDVGVDALWMDGTEGETLSACHSDHDMIKEIKDCGISAMGDFTRYLNTYSLLTTKGCYEGQRAVSNKRVLTLTRSAWAGQQRYAAIPWSGDTIASWRCLQEQIVGGLGMSMSGIPYWTQDTGGFFVNYPQGNLNKEYQELLCRWNQFAIFNPVYRWHGTNIDREPYLFKNIAPEIYHSILKAAQLRYRMTPYIYSMAWMTTKDSYTITRGLAMDFPHDKNVLCIEDEFMFGPALLTQIVTRPMYYLTDPQPEPIDEQYLFTPDGLSGVSIEYYNGRDFEEFASKTIDPKVDYTWPGPPLIDWPAGLKNKGTDFSCRIQTVLAVPEDGEYEIGVAGVDGFRLWLDGELVVDDWKSGSLRFASVKKVLKKGQNLSCRIEYFQVAEKRALRFCWRTIQQLKAHQIQLDELDNHIETYLPDGSDWFDFRSNKKYTGGQKVIMNCPLDIFPLYVRAGSILPLGPEIEYAVEETGKPFEIRVYAGGNATFSLYEDDNETYNYEKGEFTVVKLYWDNNTKTLQFGKRQGYFPGAIPLREYQVTLIDVDGCVCQPQTISYDGAEIKLHLGAVKKLT
jgi:alpha-D-xyloside xylohydrolase